VINTINNVTTNGTTTTPPTTPGSNNTTNTTGGDTTRPVLTVPENMVVETNDGLGSGGVFYTVTVQDHVDGTATLDEEGDLTQDNVRGNITIACNPPSESRLPLANHTIQCYATDAAGN
jgi:hypothetical protein